MRDEENEKGEMRDEMRRRKRKPRRGSQGKEKQGAEKNEER